MFSGSGVSGCLTSPGLWEVCVPAARQWFEGWLGGCSGNRKPEAAESETESQTPETEINEKQYRLIPENNKTEVSIGY